MNISKTIFYSIFFLFFTITLSAQEEIQDNFMEGSLEDVQAMATNEDKIIIIEFRGEEESLSKEYQSSIFNDEKINILLADKFLLYRYNPKKDKREVLKKKYKITIYPTYVFVDGQKHEIYRLAGKFSKQDFIDALNYASTPDDNMFSWGKMIKEDNTPNSDIYFKYAKGLLLGGQDYDAAAADYFKHSNVDFTKENYGVQAVLLFTDDMNDPRFIIFMENFNSLDRSDMDEKYIRNRINEIVSNSIVTALAMDGNISLEDTINNTSEKLMIEDPFLLTSLVKMKYYSSVKKNKKEYFRALSEYLMSGMFLLDEEKVHEYIKEAVADCNDQEILRMINTRLMDLISENNKSEYQKTLIDLSLKTKDYSEANHAFEVLTRLNVKSKTYSKEEMDALQAKIMNAQKEEKDKTKKNKAKKTKKKKKK